MTRKPRRRAPANPDPNPRHLAMEEFYQRADHFSELSNKLALLILVQPNAPELDYRKRLAHDHIIRAEIFREAARFLDKLPRGKKS